MANVTAEINERKLLGRTTVTVRYVRPARQRFLFWLGMKLIAAGIRCAGFGQIEYDVTLPEVEYKDVF